MLYCGKEINPGVPVGICHTYCGRYGGVVVEEDEGVVSGGQ